MEEWRRRALDATPCRGLLCQVRPKCHFALRTASLVPSRRGSLGGLDAQAAPRAVIERYSSVPAAGPLGAAEAIRMQVQYGRECKAEKRGATEAQRPAGRMSPAHTAHCDAHVTTGVRLCRGLKASKSAPRTGSLSLIKFQQGEEHAQRRRTDAAGVLQAKNMLSRPRRRQLESPKAAAGSFGRLGPGQHRLRPPAEPWDAKKPAGCGRTRSVWPRPAATQARLSPRRPEAPKPPASLPPHTVAPGPESGRTVS